MNTLFSYSITLSSFLKTKKNDLDLFESIKAIGFKNIEMFGEPQKINPVYYNDMLSSLDLQVAGVTGMWGKSSQEGWKRRLLSKDVGILKHAEKYVLSCIDLCGSFGGKVFNICLFADPVEYLDVTHSNISTNNKKEMVKRCVPLLRMLCNYANERNVKLVLEPLNRYSTPFCCNYEDANSIIQDCDNLYLMLDTFHMNIEEDVLSDVIIRSKEKLSHMHFAENNRKMPGEGHINFESIMRSLKAIDYQGFISFEPTINNENFTDHVKTGFEFIRNLESTLKT